MASSSANHFEKDETLGSLLARRNDILQNLQMERESQTTQESKQSNSGKSVNRSTQIEADDPLLRRQLEDLDQEIALLKHRLDRSNVNGQQDGTGFRPDPNTAARQVHLSLNRLYNSGTGDAVKNGTSDVNTASMTSFGSSTEASGVEHGNRISQLPPAQDQGEQMYSLLSILSSQSHLGSAQTMRLMSCTSDTCELMWRTGCHRLLIQLLHPGVTLSGNGLQGINDHDLEVISLATEALKNMVSNSCDGDICQKGPKVLRYLEKVRVHSIRLRRLPKCDLFHHDAVNAVSFLMQGSFDEKYRRVIGVLGGLLALAELLIIDQVAAAAGDRKHEPEDVNGALTAMRCHIGMALTNLTFGNPGNKQQLCSFPGLLKIVNRYIASSNEELVQVFASVVRNLSWKADDSSKEALRNAGVVAVLTRAAMSAQKLPALKSTLSAVWNLSSHCTENKAEICAIPQALTFLVGMLSYNRGSTVGNSDGVVENAGGILRNISSQIALNETYRVALRHTSCYKDLLRHLQSPSLTVVSNACGTLWNLSARDQEDQRLLRSLGAVPMLKNLCNSKHRMIAMASSAALKNLYSGCQQASPNDGNSALDGSANSLMSHRRQKAFEQELYVDQHLSSIYRLSPANDVASSSQTFGSLDRRPVVPQKEIMALVGDVVTPSSPHKSPRSRSATLHHQQTHSTASTQLATRSASNQRRSSLQRPPSSKEEKMQQDRAAVQRYHNSLKRSANKWKGKRSFEQEDVPFFESRVAADSFITKASSFAAIASEDQCYAVPSNVEIATEVVDDAHRMDPITNQTTPLMASRQSSVESLSSCDQHSICSERASVINSTVPTGIVSPSELPDSPGMISPFRTVHETTRVSDKSPIFDPAMGYHNDTTVVNSDRRGSPVTEMNAIAIEDNAKAARQNLFQQQQRASPNVNEESEYGEFFGTELNSRLLDNSIRSAIPSPRNSPNRPPQYSGYRGASKNSSANNSKGLLSDGVLNSTHTSGNTSYSVATTAEHLNVTPNLSNTTFDLPPPLSGDSSGVASRGEVENSTAVAAADDADLIRSAMPKPGDKCRHKGKPMAAAIPMVRKPNSTLPHLFEAMTSSPSQRSRSPSPDYPSAITVQQSEDQIQLLLSAAIDSALPKKTPLLYRSPKRRAPFDSNAGSTLERLQKQSAAAPNSGGAGILEASGASILIQSGTSSFTNGGVGLFNSATMGFSDVSTTNIDDVLPPEHMLVQSNSSSLGRFRPSKLLQDAAGLNSRLPTGECTTNQRSEETTAMPVIFAKQSSDGTTDGSLSEDNYSHGDDDNFDIAPEDIDLHLVEEDANEVVSRLESVGITSNNEPSNSEIVIDCETLSLVSDSSHRASIDDTMTSDDVDGSKIPRILTETEIKQRSSPKTVKGGKKVSANKSAAVTPPKVVVRTTKAAELRAKKANESSSGFASDSAVGGAGGRMVSVSPRPQSSPRNRQSQSSAGGTTPSPPVAPGVSKTRRAIRTLTSALTTKNMDAQPANPSSTTRLKKLTTAGDVSQKQAMRKQPPPPVPPKPRSVAMSKPSQTVIPSTRPAVASPKTPISNISQREKTSPRENSKKNSSQDESSEVNEKSADWKGSSKKMLVTTV